MSRGTRTIALLAALALAAAPGEASAAGMNTHGEVAERAAVQFDAATWPDYAALLRAHHDALQGGAAFPDWGYAFGYSDQSEAAHWAPFIEAAARHVRDHYPKPWLGETRKLVAFVLGIQAHSWADITWHGLSPSPPQGFLNAMAASDFGGDWGAAHGEEAGGDILCAYEMDMGWLAPSWYVPSDDLSRIYADRGMSVSSVTIGFSMSLLYAASHWALANAGGLFASYADKSPFLVEQLHDYFLGGIQEMSGGTVWKWYDLIAIIEGGGGGGAPPRATPRPAPAEPMGWDELARFAREELGVVVTRTARGVELSAAAGHGPAPAGPPPPPAADLAGLADATFTLTTAQPYDYLGTALAAGDFDGDGFDDLAIGAPGHTAGGKHQRGAVYVRAGGAAAPGHRAVDLTAAGEALLVEGEDSLDRFGAALAAPDLDADGMDDLAVGAPSRGARDLRFEGRVSVFAGSSDGLAAAPYAWVDGAARFTGMGGALASGDLDGDGCGDLVIGNPRAAAGGVQRGEVLVLLSSRGHAGIVAAADWEARGEASWDWFGSAVAVAQGGGGAILLVGAPGADAGGAANAGRLYAFAAADIIGGASVPLFTLSGARAHDETGGAFAAGRPAPGGAALLALAAPARTIPGLLDDDSRAGSVFLYGLDALAGGHTIDGLVPFSELVGAQDDGRLGWRVGMADADGDDFDDLWVTQPWRTGADGVEAGAAYSIAGGPAFPAGRVEDVPAAARLVVDRTSRWSHFGRALAFPDFNGDGCADTAVAAPRDPAPARMSGSVSLLVSPGCPVAPGEMDAGEEGAAEDEPPAEPADAEPPGEADITDDAGADDAGDGPPADDGGEGDAPGEKSGEGCGCRVAS